ncbi:MAG: MetQ/NlpA family ABC transporter substrate-binding protein [Clostridiales bacterium]|nr:MetQ/NlpA family ABC transporter substrate-binding protein [Candidatus Crickella merdequi]
MKNLKKIAGLAVTLVLGLCLLTGCGSSGDDETTIKVAACPTPHAEVLEQVKDALAEDGWTLEIVEFEDYVKPNQALTDGDVDANYFQHVPYLDQYNEENGTDIISVGTVHYEAMGIYKGTKSAINELSSGDKIGVPNDVTNEARALQLLEANGVIKLRDGAGLKATKADIVSNPYGVEIVELDPAIIPNSLPDLALAVINANYAIEADVIGQGIVFEASDSDAAQTYANIIACRNGEENSEKIQALVKAVQSETVKAYLNETYKGVIQTIF